MTKLRILVSYFLIEFIYSKSVFQRFKMEMQMHNEKKFVNVRFSTHKIQTLSNIFLTWFSK